MEERRLTVYNRRGAFKEAPPQILLQGRWLKRAGFNAGNKITANCQQGRLFIIKDGPETDTGTGNMTDIDILWSILVKDYSIRKNIVI